MWLAHTMVCLARCALAVGARRPERGFHQGSDQPRCHIFVSYQQREAAHALNLLSHNWKRAGVHCWSILYGDVRRDKSATKQGVRSSDAFLLVLSHSVLSDEQIREQIEWARGSG